MRRQSGYEDDWIRALNEAGNLANTLSQTKARGLQTQITEQEVADKQRKDAIANAIAMILLCIVLSSLQFPFTA